MNKSSIILIVVLFILVVVGMFMFSSFKNEEIQNTDEEENVEPTEQAEVPDPKRIDAKHFYIDGTHTFVGEITMPTPCDLVDVSAMVMESYPEQIKLDFKVINTADTCAQVLTNQRFSVEATASREATVTATFNGQPAELNLIPAAVGETPDEFEIYIKG
ncbi:MAG: hypothetical protein R3B60_03525 [Candidatus Paceibacterota bacterium]